ncbi:Usually multiple acids move in and out Transporters 23 [Hibiscus trionum]|uniref:WAT1-related protein n=1 Tax=Hibiscus trionum TaxID=183268 RepID=A0A9W7I3P1_HIBTR|nr:Usually multiple acids move in and out Transporters 23 [Hibiscus trionum]
MGQIVKILNELKPATVMVMVQALSAGLNVLYKLAADDGMNLRIIVAYRNLFATAVMVPLALIVERKRPKMTWTILVQGFLCALVGGSLAQNLYIESLSLTSTTFICAMTNLSPAITFIIAITIGLEKLAFRTMAGKAKVLGTVIGIGGAMLLTFYKGPQFNISTHIDLLPNGHHGTNSSHPPPTHHLLGALLAFVCCICYSVWMNLQAKMSQKYPCHYSSTALTCLFAAVQSVVFALCVERDMSLWKLGWNIRLLTVAYSGVFGMGVTFSMMAWCLRIKGPLYTSVFNPLVLVLVAIAGSLFLEEKLNLGTIIGAVLIVAGLYVVLWGKGKEMKKTSKLVPENEAVEVVVTSSLDANTPIISNDNSVVVGKDLPIK